MINVLHLRETDRVCGPGKTIIETVCATDRTAFTQKVGLFLPPGDGKNAYYEAAERRGVEIIPLRAARSYDPRLVATILRVIAEHDIHLVHSHEAKSDLFTYAVACRRRLPIMTTVHGWITNNWKSRVRVRASQWLLRGFDRVVAVSEGTRARILACGVPADRIEVIHNAIVMPNYRAADHAPGFLRGRFSLPPEAIIVGSIGRLSPEKGQFDLLTAMAAVATALPALHVVFAGDGPDRAGLEARATELGLGGRVHFTGHLHDVRPVYRDLDVLALTSYTEGFPNVVLEALSMDVPVLATDVGGTGEIVQNEVTGVLIPAGAPDRIADGLRRLLLDRAGAARLAAEGKRAVAARFAFESRVRREEALYRDILASWEASRGSSSTRVAT